MKRRLHRTIIVKVSTGKEAERKQVRARTSDGSWYEEAEGV